jgi:hypothetical protein
MLAVRFAKMAIQIVCPTEWLGSAAWNPTIVWSVSSVARPLMTLQMLLSLELLTFAVLVNAVFCVTRE